MSADRCPNRDAPIVLHVSHDRISTHATPHPVHPMPPRRVLHTSDWHLGQSFHDYDRTWEHQMFLDWLVGTVAEQAIDAVLISGDIFDTANPPNSAQRQWADVLVRIRQARPSCEIVAISGNHDSAARLGANDPFTQALGLHVVSAARSADAAFDPSRLVIPLTADDGEVWGHVAAIPFLRGDDLGTLTELQAEDAFMRLSRARFGAVFDELNRRATPGTARFAMAHGVIVGATASSADAPQASVSERDVRIGNVAGLPVDLFPEDLTYVALGHLHRAQKAGGRAHVRYAGSPLPLHVSEADYPHQVRLITVEDGALVAQTKLLVPKRVPVIRVPKDGPLDCDAVLAELKALPKLDVAYPHEQPYLEVRFAPTAPRPGFDKEVGEALSPGGVDKGYRLTVIKRESVRTDADVTVTAELRRSLHEFDPVEVFRIRYRRQYPGQEPSPSLEQAFLELVAEAKAGKSGGAA
jgi:exonuclease SbcD